MEPINYRDALRRRWPVVVALAVVGALIGGLLPVHVPYPPPHAEYEASSLIGITPGSATKGTATISQIKFFSANLQVVGDAAKAAHVKEKAANLVADVTFPSAKKKKKQSSTPPGTIRVSVKQPSAKRSAKLTNAFVSSLIAFMNARLVAQHQKDLRIAEQKVSNYSNQIQSLDTQIAALQPPPASTTTTTVPKTTTTTAPKTTTTTTPTTTTTKAAAFRGQVGGTPAVLVASKSNPDLALLQEQLAVASTAYQGAVSSVNALKQTPAPTSGIQVLQPATAHKATKTTVKKSSLNSHSVRGLLGLVGGAVLGVGLTFLLDALDKRLRTATRTQETLQYPVLAEIPVMDGSQARGARGRRREVAPPAVYATFTEPGSAVAEAYRMLRTAVLLEPIITPGAPPARSPGLSSPGSTSTAASAGSDGPASVASGTQPVPDRRSRQVVLVVSAGVEPTRALVVTNLAAAFAEAGEQALIVTTADLRERDRLPDTLVVAPVGGDPSGATVASSARPTEVPGVRSLALSSLIEGPGHLATRSAAVLSSAREVADVVIVDAPLLAVHDAEALVPAVDVVVVVVQSWWTRVDQATRSGAFLRRISAPVLGAVLTEVRLGKKDLRRVVEPPKRRNVPEDDEDDDRLVRASSSARLRRKQGRDARMLDDD